MKKFRVIAWVIWAVGVIVLFPHSLQYGLFSMHFCSYCTAVGTVALLPLVIYAMLTSTRSGLKL